MTNDQNRTEIPADDIDVMETETTSQEKTRLCLVCGDEFVSAWAGERVCKRCRSSSKWRQG